MSSEVLDLDRQTDMNCYAGLGEKMMVVGSKKLADMELRVV